MFEIAYKDLRNEHFRNSMTKLSNCPDYGDVKVAYNVMRMAKALEAKLKESQKEWLEIADPLIAREENGNFKINKETGEFEWREGVDPAAAKLAIEKYTNKTTVVERHPLNVQVLVKAKLTPADLANLEPLLAGLDELNN